MSKLKGYKTIIINVLTIIIVLLKQVVELDILGVSAEALVSFVAILNIVIRFFTDSPIFNKQTGI